MWIFTKHGFFSVVCARKGDGAKGQPVDGNRMMVRARIRSHLEALQKRFPDLLRRCEICEFAGSDYGFRLFVPKEVWTQVLAALGDEINYDNFKDRVKIDQGHSDYELSLHDVWSVMHRLQEQ